MGEPSSDAPEGTPSAQTPTMLSIYLERSQTSYSQTSEPEGTPVSRPAASESPQLLTSRQLAAGLAPEAATAGALAEPPTGAPTGTSYAPLAPQSYVLPPASVPAPASISALSSSSLSLSSLPRQPAAGPGHQTVRAQAAAAAPFSPSSSALSLPSTAAEEGYGDPGDPSSSAQARGITAEELASMDPKRAKRLIANRQSAQRSKARKLRHIMQLEDEVQSLQGLTQQQAARIGALQQDNALLSGSNQQLGASNADLQGQLGSYEAYVELCVQELRRLSVLANEPFQLPAIPAPAQAAQQAPAPGFGQPELALQQQLAPQGRLQGPMQYPIQAQQLPAGGVPTQPVGGPRLGAQRQQGPAILSSSFPPGYQPAMGRGGVPGQRPDYLQRQTHRGVMPNQGGPLGLGPAHAQAGPTSDPRPMQPAPQAAEASEEGAAAAADIARITSLPSSGGSAQEAARHALAMADQHRMQASGNYPPQDAGQAAIAAAEARRAAMSTEGRGQPTGPMGPGLQRAMLRTLSSGQEGAAAGRAPAQVPSRRTDPFRMTVPASAFRMEGRSSTDTQEAPQTPSRRQMQQQLPSMPTMPEQQAIVDMAQWGQPVGWPLGPRAQQPYPAVSVSSVGSVMSAFRRLDVQHASDPTGYAITPRTPMTPQQQLRMQSQLPLLQGRYGNLSWDEMMRSLSDPLYGYDAQGVTSYPQGLYPHPSSQISRAAFQMFYNPEQQQQMQPGEEDLGQPPPQ
ncbi:hypothetical protein CVIRNUC_001703 [Coccomyxa viridis]|uniref:BZIP domain-containing protein n=1 Tax=Coccomyxa viridis TaxID=1274662 RepID=A0AAV1HU40_9CHLO|nr:hypothetical protein CVIRNUC_001703 [Coccomyxa viridis]